MASGVGLAAAHRREQMRLPAPKEDAGDWIQISS